VFPLFNRPPGIYKEDYLRELFTLYGDIDDTLPAPALPMWHCEADDDIHSKEERETVDGIYYIKTIILIT
jgi:mRNA-capping enzyme